MHCPYCKAELTRSAHCEKCGSYVKDFKKLYSLSNRCYNDGLAKAKIRDLTGAITSLRNSIKINKRNIDARNLLGLVYNELGEVVEALSEWIISDNIQRKDNIASKYLNYFKNNPIRLESASRTIKKYNGALRLAQGRSYDLAIIQLKKIASTSNNIKVLNLLGLLNIKMKNYTQASKYLNVALSVDLLNPQANLYLKEIPKNEITEDNKNTVSDKLVLNARESFAPISSYRERKHSIFLWINLLIGMIIGMAFFMVAIVPGIKAKLVEDKKNEIVQLNETMAKTNAEFDQITSKNEALAKQVETLTNKNKELSELTKKSETGEYGALMEAAAYYVMEDPVGTAESLLKVDKSKLQDNTMLNLYNQLSSKVFVRQSQRLFGEGYNAYSRGRYEEAIEIFATSLKMNPDNVNSIYFTGRAYDRLQDKVKAAEWYNNVINNYSNTQKAVEARRRLRALGI